MPSLTSQVLSSNYVKFVYNQYQLNIYEKEKDLIEYELVFNARPLFSQISLPFTIKNLIGYYQPPLYEEYKEIPKGWFVNATHVIDEKGETVDYRPINVVDSIAFYYVKSGNEYGTGKAFHLYRPVFIDAKGNQAYCNITYVNNVLTIIFPKEFLDKAVYPVVLDPSFGYTSIGGSNTGNSFGGNNGKIGCKFQTIESGTLTGITLYSSGVGTTITGYLCLYSDNLGIANALLDYSTSAITIQSNPSWESTIGRSYALTAASDYWLVVNYGDVPNYFRVYYDSGGTNQWVDQGNTHEDTPPPDNPFGVVQNYQNRILSIYATYTISTSAFTYSLSDTGIATDQNFFGVETLSGTLETGSLSDLTLMGLARLYNFGETSIAGEITNMGLEIFGVYTYTITSIAQAYDVVVYTFQTTLEGDVKYLALVLAISAIALVLVGISNRR